MRTAVVALALLVAVVQGGVIITKDAKLPDSLLYYKQYGFNFTTKNTQTLPTPPAPAISIQSMSVSPTQIRADIASQQTVRVKVEWTGALDSTSNTDLPFYVSLSLQRRNQLNDFQSTSAFTTPSNCIASRNGKAHTYDCGFQVNTNFPNGPWNITMTIQDHGDSGTGQYQSFSTQDIFAFTNGTIVSSNCSDFENPVIHGFGIVPNTFEVDAFGNHQEINYWGSCDDDKGGTNWQAIFTGGEGDGSHNLGATMSISGSGTTTSLFNKKVGTWKLKYIKCYDNAYNLHLLWPDEAAARGFTTEFTITRNLQTNQNIDLVRVDQWLDSGFGKVYDLGLGINYIGLQVVASNVRKSARGAAYFQNQDNNDQWVTISLGSGGGWYGPNVKLSGQTSLSPYAKSGYYKMVGFLVWADFSTVHVWGTIDPVEAASYLADWNVVLGDGTSGTVVAAAPQQASVSAVVMLFAAAVAVFAARRV